MKIYKDFDINFANDKDVDVFIQRVKENKRDSRFLYSEEYSQNGQPGIIQVLTSNVENIPNSRILLYPTEKTVSIINIVPLPPVGQLSHDEYNTLIDLYDKNVLSLLYNDLDVNRKDAKDFIDIQEKMPLTFCYLEQWARIANTGDPFSHPLDLKRWHHFVCENVVNSETAFCDLIQDYVHEEIGWNKGLAEEVAIRYEQDRNIVKYFIDNYN